jgi:hypothetical protein
MITLTLVDCIVANRPVTQTIDVQYSSVASTLTEQSMNVLQFCEYSDEQYHLVFAQLQYQCILMALDYETIFEEVKMMEYNSCEFPFCLFLLCTVCFDIAINCSSLLARYTYLTTKSSSLPAEEQYVQNIGGWDVTDR